MADKKVTVPPKTGINQYPMMLTLDDSDTVTIQMSDMDAYHGFKVKRINLIEALLFKDIK